MTFIIMIIIMIMMMISIAIVIMITAITMITILIIMILIIAYDMAGSLVMRGSSHKRCVPRNKDGNKKKHKHEQTYVAFGVCMCSLFVLSCCV